MEAVEAAPKRKNKGKKKRPVSFIPRSKKLLERLNYYVDISESRMPSFSVRDQKTGGWRQLPGRKKDLFGFADLAAIREDGLGCGTLYVQVCAVCDVAKRLWTIRSIAAARAALKTGNQIWIMGWTTYETLGGSRRRYVPRFWNLSFVDNEIFKEEFDPREQPSLWI